MKVITNTLTPSDLLERGWEIIKDTETDYYRFSALHWVEESGLCDTPEEAVEYLREYLREEG